MILPQGEKSSMEMQGFDGVKKVEKGASFHDVTLIAEVPPIESINSAFQMSEYLNLLVQHNPHDIETIVEVPEYHSHKSSGPSGDSKEKNLWIYEHLRRLPIDLTPLTASLLRECSAQSCPEMKAGEWQYICVANHQGKTEDEGRMDGHGKTEEEPKGQGNQCCALDYILHTLDSHTALWNSSQAFPSRLSIKPGSERYFGTQARRISRIFSHAWYAHREIFEEAEAETALYRRFVAIVKRYELMNPNLLVIPSTAYDVSDVPEHSDTQSDSATVNSLEVKTEGAQSSSSPTSVNNSSSEPSANSTSQSQPKFGSIQAGNDGKHDNASLTDALAKHANSVSRTDKAAADDEDFRRDRFATPVTATKVDHGFKDVLGGSDRTIGRGTLGRGRGKGIRKALFAVDVPAEEDEDEVDTHVEHVDIAKDDKLDDDKSSSAKETSGHSATNGIAAKNSDSSKDSDSKQKCLKQNISLPAEEKEEGQKDEPIMTADGVEFNV